LLFIRDRIVEPSDDYGFCSPLKVINLTVFDINYCLLFLYLFIKIPANKQFQLHEFGYSQNGVAKDSLLMLCDRVGGLWCFFNILESDFPTIQLYKPEELALSFN
jgi:hypothetical protein